jgi:hexosaminidase
MYMRMEAVSRTLEWTGVRHRANYGPMLDRLAGGQSAEPLRVLADASEAQGLGPRARAMKYTSLVPLNRFVDAVRPESELVRAMSVAATRLAAKSAQPGDEAFLREQFARWASNDLRFQRLAEGNAVISELKGLSKDLSALGETGLRLLDALGGKAAPASWIAQQKTEMTRLSKVQVEVILAAYRPVKILLESIR